MKLCEGGSKICIEAYMKLGEGNGGTQCPLIHVLAVLQDSIRIGL